MKNAVAAAAAALLLVVGSAWAAEQTLSGTLSDTMCGADHSHMGAKMSDRDCTQACAAHGGQYALVSSGKVYKLTDHASDLKTHAGHAVNLTGDVKGDTIRVSKVEMPAASK